MLPDRLKLVEEFLTLTGKTEHLTRCAATLQTGLFTDQDGRSVDVGAARINLEEAALLSHLCRKCPQRLSVEIGFGTGLSAAVILGTRALLDKPFEHLIFDPYGLGSGKGKLIEEYLQSHFGESFQRIKKPSEIGLGQLLYERKGGCAGLIFIDGGHHFENVMTDFFLSDKLCCKGGYIVFDDALFPAIESVLNYIRANRPDYEMVHLPVKNSSVIRKATPDHREWMAFTPFEVPKRRDWTPAPRSGVVR